MAEEIVLDTKEWDAFLNNAQNVARDFSKYLLAGVNIFGFQDVMDHFSKESGPSGAWPKRKATTDRAYDILGGKYSSSNKLLQLTGGLRKELMPGSHNVTRRDRLSVEMYSTKVYSHRHDMGTEGMPQREFLWLSDKAKGLMLTLIMDKMVGD